uniref:G-protein coupled receptors family 1 profile domain-containing protein n=1 Tax=Sphaeramia orbicularis TaxID=375764 RepID=A0A673AZN7_9TELE
SDLVHVCSQTISIQSDDDVVEDVFFFISGYFEISSVCFMVCVALERYLVIAHPLWYRFSQPIKISILISVLVWLFPLIFVFLAYFGIDISLFCLIFYLLPLPLFIFFLVGAVRALSAAIHITSTEKQQIIGTLLSPVLTYSLIFLPYTLWALVEKIRNNNEDLGSELVLFFRFSPPANAILYVFIRKGALDKLLAYLCCCKVDNDETNTIAV